MASFLTHQERTALGENAQDEGECQKLKAPGGSLI